MGLFRSCLGVGRLVRTAADANIDRATLRAFIEEYYVWFDSQSDVRNVPAPIMCPVSFLYTLALLAKSDSPISYLRDNDLGSTRFHSRPHANFDSYAFLHGFVVLSSCE